MKAPIKKAVIRQIAEKRRIPIAAAAHAYACMSIDRKNLLCAEEEHRQAALTQRSEVSA